MEWTKDQILGIEDLGLSKLWIEIDEQGNVIREIGFDSCQKPVHFGTFGKKGNFLFDGQRIELKTNVPIQNDEIITRRFEEVWEQNVK